LTLLDRRRIKLAFVDGDERVQKIARLAARMGARVTALRHLQRLRIGSLVLAVIPSPNRSDR